MRINMLIGGLSVNLDILLPERWRKYRPEKGRCMWLLHDKFDDSGDWVSFTQAELFANQYDIALICPSMNSARYNNWIGGAQWQTYFTDGLWDYVHSMLPLLSCAKEDNLLFGFGRGGFGAVKFALACPEKYGEVWSVSFDDAFLDGVREGRAHSFPGGSGYGTPEEFAKTQDDLPRFAADYAASGNPLPHIHMSGMTGEKSLQRNRDFCTLLQDLGYPVDWSERTLSVPGGRQDDSSGGANGNWFFCNEELGRALAAAANKS